MATPAPMMASRTRKENEQYENPRELEKQLREEKERQAAKVARGEELDEYDWERLQDLKERVCFAYQDEEYDEEQDRLAEFYGER